LDTNQLEIQEKAQKFISSCDLIPPDHVVFDGSRNYLSANSKSPSDKTGRYVGHDNMTHLVLLCWNWAKTGDEFQKLIIPKNGRPHTPKEKRQNRKLIEQARYRYNEERDARYEDQATYAKRVFEKKVVPADPNHPYLKKKGVPAYGIYKMQNGTDLLIPLKDINGKIWSYQRIKPSGEKQILTGSRKDGTFHLIRGTGHNKMSFFCEGYATGATIYEATGGDVYVCLDTSNLPKVIEAYVKKCGYGDGIVICGDEDAWIYEWIEKR
jgi:putative DNA primase/helicase